MKYMGMHVHSADACRRNEGDDECSAQAEAVENCQTTTSLPSTHKLFVFFFFFPRSSKHSQICAHFLQRKLKRDCMCFCQTTYDPWYL